MTMSEEYVRKAKVDFERIVKAVLFGPEGCMIYVENDYMCDGCTFGDPENETCRLYEMIDYGGE